MPKTYRVTVQTADGSTLFSGTVATEELAGAAALAPAPAGNGSRPASTDGERMTDPQKRYLFRLLGAQGLDGKQAEAHLKSYFKVTRLVDIPKALASEYINQLVKDRQEASGASA